MDLYHVELQPLTFYRRVYCLVRRIPTGRVVSYGAVAAALGAAHRARAVGYALHLLPPDTTVPWHRVINAHAKISIRGDDIRARIQHERLISEGLIFDAHGKTDLERFGYRFSIPDINACQDTNPA